MQPHTSAVYTQLSCLLLLLTLCVYKGGSVDARQIRISRYNVEVDEDNTESSLGSGEDSEYNATVREVTPYPAAGFRPGRAFNLPNEGEEDASGADVTTTEWSASKLDSTTYEPETTTSTPLAEFTTVAEETVDSYVRKAPYPASGYRPRRPFNLPTEDQATEEAVEPEAEDEYSNDADKTVIAAAAATARGTSIAEAPAVETVNNKKVAPYPAAGYRPCKPFNLPTENLEQSNATVSNKQNPACGVSTNPLAPKPPAGSADEPDAESVPVSTNKGNVAVGIVPAALTVQQPIILQQPLTVAQPFVYTTHFQTW